MSMIEYVSFVVEIIKIYERVLGEGNRGHRVRFRVDRLGVGFRVGPRYEINIAQIVG